MILLMKVQLIASALILAIQYAGGVQQTINAVPSPSVEAQFDLFVEEYGRVYSTVGERAQRFAAFKVPSPLV